MSLKVYAGPLKGLRFFAPPSNGVPPTSENLRRRPFEKWQDMSGICFIDLCAGSGLVGIEAASRGAGPVYLIENDRHLVRTVTSLNIQQVKNFWKKERREGHSTADIQQLEVVQADVFQWLTANWHSLLEIHQEIIFFFDPPYENHKIYSQVLNFFVDKSSEFSENRDRGEDFFCQLWVEFDQLKVPLDKLWSAKKIADKEYKQSSRLIRVYDFPFNE